MNTIDLLSGNSPDIPTPTSLDHITEETNQCENYECEMSSALSAVAASAAAAASPSLLSSSSEQQPTIDPTAIYQINFDVEHLGKNKPQSKRMAIWKYGIPQESATTTTTTTNNDNNGNGSSNHKHLTIACHEAMLTWSTHSGKYTISVDGEEVFSNIAKGSVLEHKWKWSHYKGCIADDGDEEDVVPMRIIACRKPPIRTSKDFRCYEFLIGGKVFRDLPKNDLDEYCEGGGYRNEESRALGKDGKLMSILDIVDPGWRSEGFA
eukprot:CAMPEP_0196231404 /NCGR_PEP_ID=MMETSP0913-20130531/2215_1 /TAXON_ID=49265 /ORGANISM="Thalassiosira rotula, Strain GSO102" /LENGTH=264 /DNA_ID=CAMNT_0041511571 /DNA_START=40 /DNA_END=834 /DNA_ORIENTATION=-